jgi:hypothetical protein
MIKASPKGVKFQSAMADSLCTATAHRIDQQIKRAFLHTYAAEAGLRMLVRLGATEMLRAGATPDAVRAAILARIERHSGQDKTSLITGQTRSTTLSHLMLEWCDDVCAGPRKVMVQ